jgi:quercetin dioxygenase-like cupin family protein
MKFSAGLVLVLAALAYAPPATVLVPNLAQAKWTHDTKDGSDSVFLFQDPKTGGIDLLVRYPAGHKLTPHWHSVNERLVLLEGAFSVKSGDASETTLSAGGILLSPAGERHGLSCTSEGPCAFYISWDGKLDTHR